MKTNKELDKRSINKSTLSAWPAGINGNYMFSNSGVCFGLICTRMPLTVTDLMTNCLNIKYYDICINNKRIGSLLISIRVEMLVMISCSVMGKTS